MSLSKVALLAGLLQLAAAIPSNSSSRSLNKRDDPFFSDLFQPLFTEIQQTQLKQGFADACSLAQAGLTAAKKDNPIYMKYFNNDADTVNNVQEVFKGIVGNKPPPGGTCSTQLGFIGIYNDFPDDKNELSCTTNEDMASTRGGQDANIAPMLVICPSTLQHGNIGPKVIPNAPAPVTCDFVKEGGQRTTWRMNTIGSTLLHEYTHMAWLVEKALPQGTKDTLDHSDDPNIPEDTVFSYYGPVDIQGDLRRRRDGVKSIEIADAYTYFAMEAFWSAKCGVTFGLAQGDDGDDPKFGGSPGQDPDSEDPIIYVTDHSAPAATPTFPAR